MQSKQNKPNSIEKRWLKSVADFHNDHGCEYLYGVEWSVIPFQIHHVCGRSYKQNKVSIGHWFILPVPHTLHDVHSNHNLNVTHYRHSFTDRFGTQRSLFKKLIDKMSGNGLLLPSDEILNAIMLTRY